MSHEILNHVSVLINESIELLKSNPKGIYLDCTFGRGGHSQKILENLDSQGRLIAIDKDQKLSKIIVVDDAGGMSPDVLRTSLGVGRGRALEENKANRVGKGKTSKFGLGLKNL